MSDTSLAATRLYHPLVDLTQHIAQTRKIHEKNSKGSEFHQRRLAIYDRTCATLDVDAFAQLQDKHRHELADFNPYGHVKYFDLPYWIWHKTELAVELDLDRKIAGTILDLGVGAGHFPAICQAYGHKVVGIDIANDQYDDLCAYFRVERITQRILPRQPLPDFDMKFNLVTAIWISFDSIYVDRGTRRIYWTLEDWKFLLHDLNKYLRLPAEIYLEPNRQVKPDGTEAYDDVFIDMCQRNGADIQRLAYTRKIKFSLDSSFDIRI